MIASTFTDPVLGLDIHIVLVPSPAGPIPTPLPMPFTGMVLDPVGAAMNKAMGGSLVLIGGMIATNCGTKVMNLPPHLPVPGPFAKGKLDNDAELLFGALNVSIGGSLAVRLGEIALSCSDPSRMPTSTVLATPKGSLVLVQRPPVPDLTLIATQLAFKAVLKGAGAAFRALRRAQQGSKFFQGLSAKLRFKDAGGSRGRQMWNDGVCFLTGHPVDVATGRVITSQLDLELPGSLPLRFVRRYDSSASDRPGPLGHGWSHNFDQALWQERGRFVYRAEDGREIEFSTLHFPDKFLAPGREVFLPRERLTLRAVTADVLNIEDAGGVVREFATIPGTSDRIGRLVRVRTRLGETQRLDYGADGRLESVTDPAGRQLRFTHDREGRLVRVDVAGTDGQIAPVGAYAVDAAGDLVEAKDAFGRPYRYEYVEHLLVQETNRNGLAFYFQYDGIDSTAKCVHTWGDGGIYDHVITYDTAGMKTLVENSLGQITLYQLDEMGQVVAITDALGRATKLEYDENSGQTCKETDPAEAATTREYDARGNLVKVVQPDGAEMVFEYDERDRPIHAVDAMGGEWRWAYDREGRLVGRANPLRQTTQFHWDGPRLVAVTDPAGQHTQLGYDPAGNVAALVTPDGARAEWTYDGFGRARTAVDPKGNTVRRERDALGRVVRVHEADGNVRTVEYDAESNVVHAVDRHHDVRFEYRGMNRLAARSEAGARVEFGYDAEDRLVAIKNEHGSVYRFVLNAAGDLDEEHGFDGLRRRFLRDPAGRVQEVRRPEGKTTKYAYSAAGRVESVEHSEGPKETYAYRKDGEIVSARSGAIEIAFERDALGRVLKEIQGDDWVLSEYDALGFRTRVRSSKGFTQAIRRNTMGDMVGVEADVQGAKLDTRSGRGTPGASFAATFERDQLGMEIERSLPGGVRARWQRDQLGRPVQHEIWRGSKLETARQYVWDVDDRLVRIVDAMKGPIEYSHDALGKLASAAYADGRVDLRMPDAVGNLFRTRDRSDRVYGAAGQLLEARSPEGVTRYQYDPEGNLSKKIEPGGGVWTYHWNGAGMLVKVVRSDGGVVEMTYDALGRRVSKTYRGRTTRWIWDGNVPLHEWVEREPTEVAANVRPAQTDAAPGVAAKARDAVLAGRPAQGPPALTDADFGTKEAPITWVFEPESFAPLAKVVDGRAYGIVTDHLGTPARMYDAAGSEAWAADIDTYGALRNLHGPRQACPFRWPGQYEDEETGLYYNRFRHYDPESGEYLSQDPLGLRAGMNVYSYVADPLSWLDPFGLSGCGKAAKSPPNPFGKKGGPAHQAKVGEVAADIESRGLEVGFEHKVPTPGGTKGTRFVDVVGKDAEGNVVEMHQVGRQTQGGAPVSREVKALDDIQGATGTRPQYHPYN